MDDQGTTGTSAKRRFRELRIAWSVGWGVACVLLIALWVRSQKWQDAIVGNLTNRCSFGVVSAKGRVRVVGIWHSHPSVEPLFRQSEDISMYRLTTWLRDYPFWKFGIHTKRENAAVLRSLTLPYWTYIVLSIGIDVAPWNKWHRRFSLLTLLIASTLVAVGLGVAVYALRWW